MPKDPLEDWQKEREDQTVEDHDDSTQGWNDLTKDD